MSAVTLPSKDGSFVQKDKAHLDIKGALDLSFKFKDGETSLDRLYYRDPLKLLFPRGDVMTAALITTGGGLFGGDHYDIRVKLGEGAQALVCAQASEKVYKSTGEDCIVDVDLSVEPSACLEWLPQETILFDRSRFKRKTTLHVAKNGVACVGEIIVFGRLASGEEVEHGVVREEWQVSYDGRDIWRDILYLKDNIQKPLNHPSAFNGARAVASCVLVFENAQEKLDYVRDALGGFENVFSGATAFENIIICRWLAKDPYDLRKAFGFFWTRIRSDILMREKELPRLWQC